MTPEQEKYQDFHVIMVGTWAEKVEARNAGWDDRDILFASYGQLEGRRYKSIHITWQALWEIRHKDSDMFQLLESNAILQDARTGVGLVVPPPPKDVVAKQEVLTLVQIAEGLAPKFIQPVTENCIYGCSHVHE